MEEVMVEPILTLQPWEDPTLQHVGGALKETVTHGEPMQEQAPRKSCGLWRGAHTGAGFLAGTAALGKRSPCPYLNPGAFPSLFLPLCC